MIDIHSHILPAIDDGPQSMEESLLMCRMAADDGIRTVVATPHFASGNHEWGAAALQNGVTALQGAIRAAGLDLTLLPGAELSLSPELPPLLTARNSPLTLNRGIYFLIEFSAYTVPANAEPFLHSLMDAGLVPVIAHPERCAWFMRQPSMLSRLAGRGALMQLTAGSILGQFGPEVRNFSQSLITGGLAHVIASDAHDTAERAPLLSEAVSLVADLIGEERARDMVTGTPAAIIAGRRLPLTALATGHFVRPLTRRSWLRRLLDAAA